MEGSNSSGKKIVFTKGILAPKSEEGEVLPSVEEIAPEPQSEEPSVDTRYEGEIFDQFYRPVSATGGIDRLRELARELTETPTPPARLSRHEREDRASRHQELAEALAHQIFHLAQKARETDIDLYLSACNVVLADKSPYDAKDILDRANEYFSEHYYTAIRDRGERPEISHQIIKRVGHEAADRISRIVLGLDVEKAAAHLWELYHGPHTDKEPRITDTLLECTSAQIVAIRDEFMLIPYKSLAKQAHAILTAQTTDPKPAARKSIGKGEVHEQKKQAAFRARDDMRALRYLFLGRSADEMALVKRFYLDLSDHDLPESDISLEAHVRKCFSQTDVDRLGTLLDGWSPHQEAQELHDLLHPKTFRNELEDFLSDPRDVVDRDHTQGIGPFLKRFRKRRMWRDKTGIFHRVLNAWEVIAERISALTPDRFLATNQALFELKGYELDPTMFPSLEAFDARRIAMVVAERLSVSGDFFEIVSPFCGLDPRRCFAVQQAFHVVRGLTLKEAIDARLQKTGSDLSVQHRGVYFDRYCNGQGRISLDGDILGRYRGEEGPPGVWQSEYRSLAADEEAAIHLAKLMDSESAVGELDLPVREFCAERSYDALSRLERAFFDLTDPHMSLREALRNCVSAEVFDLIDLMFSGVHGKELVDEIRNQPAMAIMLRDLPPSHIKTIRGVFEQTYFVQLDQFLLESFSEPQDEDVLVEALSCVLLPEIYEARGMLQKASRSAVDQIDFVREQCTGKLSRIMSFERGFDLHFTRLRVTLKFAAARMALSSGLFAELMLCLEGVDPEINQRLLEYFDAVDVDALLDTLRHYKRDQGIIEETFDLLNPEAQLRRSIKEMKVDLDIINETLLHLEGYSSKDVAEELHDLVEDHAGAELGEAVLGVLAPPMPQRPNTRIPEDINWMDEMAYQIGLAYHREYRQDLVEACRTHGVPEHQLEDLTGRVFGMEVCASAKELYTLLQTAKDGGTAPEHAEQRICSYLESRGLRYRARFVRAYNAFWAHYPGFGSLLDDIDRFIRDIGVRKKMHALLLGVGTEPRSTAKGGSVIMQ